MADIIIPISLCSSRPEFFKNIGIHFGVKKYLGIFLGEEKSAMALVKNGEGKVANGRGK